MHSVEHGGTERQLCRIVRRLAADTDTRHIVCTQRHVGPRSVELAGAADVVSLGAGARDRFAFVRLARLIRSENVSVVHARNLGTWADAVLACTLARQGQPILAFHGLQSGATFGNSHKLRSQLLRYRSRRMTAVSVAARDLLVSELGCSPSRVTVLSNGVDVERFAPPTRDQRLAARTELGLAPDDFAVGMVANYVSPVKGHAVFIEAAAMLARSNPRLKFVLAGLGPIESLALETISASCLADRFVFTGAREDVRTLLWAFDAFACPSLSEGMSNALLEAMACGLPCVVTEVAEHMRMFSGVDPLALVPPGEPEALAAAMAGLTTDLARRVESGKRGREMILRSYDFERTVEAYRRYYAGLVAGERCTKSAAAEERPITGGMALATAAKERVA